MFDRFGRKHRPKNLPLTTNDNLSKQEAADYIARRIWLHASSFLLSSDYEFIVNLDEMTRSIENGRFGEFSIKAEVEK